MYLAISTHNLCFLFNDNSCPVHPFHQGLGLGAPEVQGLWFRVKVKHQSCRNLDYPNLITSTLRDSFCSDKVVFANDCKTVWDCWCCWPFRRRSFQKIRLAEHHTRHIISFIFERVRLQTHPCFVQLFGRKQTDTNLNPYTSCTCLEAPIIVLTQRWYAFEDSCCSPVLCKACKVQPYCFNALHLQ